MKFPYSMLLDYVQTDLNAEQVGDLLTMAGFELEGIEEVEGDSVLDIKVVSNRGDGLSVYGLSREVLAKDTNARRTPLANAADERFGDFHPEPNFQIDLDTATISAEECNRFACRVYENVPVAAQSPEWMQLRLRQSGMRPISLLVDLTNYVMLELGQPLHAFDREKLAEGRIVVRHAKPGEKLTTLNGEEHELDGQMMICDARKPVGVPGVMGGLETEVTDDTRVVLLESANFRNTTVRKTRKQLGLNTEASYRFERSVDPDGVVAAIRRFTQLLQEIAPEVRVSNVVDHYPRPPQVKPVRLRVARASRLLGMEITPEQARDYLGRLGFDLREDAPGEFTVSHPSWRPDIVREEDLIEELGRVHGYDRIPEALPIGSTPRGGSHGFELFTDQLRDAAVRAGYVQTVSHSLRDKGPLDDPTVPLIGPRNPASPEMAYLRNSVLSSLGDAARRNGGNVHLFEIGRVFGQESAGYAEHPRFGMLASGPVLPAAWGHKASANADFFTLKGDLEEVLKSVATRVTFKDGARDPRLHPTRQAQIVSGDQVVGFIGQLHPDIAEEADLNTETVVAEISLASLFASRQRELDLRTVSRNPAVRRDISFLIDKSVPYESVSSTLLQATGPVLEKMWLFDVYAGQGIPEGKHSLSVALQLRKLGENFTDEEANQVREKAVEALAALGATPR